MYQPTEEKIRKWKKENPKGIFQITLAEQGFSCVLKMPSRAVLGAASQAAIKNPLKFGEVIMNNCWLEGDPEIQEDDGLFFSVAKKIDEMITIADATLKKL